MCFSAAFRSMLCRVHKGCSKSKIMLCKLTVLCKRGLMRLNRYEVKQLCRVGCYSFPWVPSWATVGWVSPTNRRLNLLMLPLHLFPLLLCWNPVLVSIKRAHRHMYCLMTTAMNHLSFKNVTLEKRALIMFFARCINKQDCHQHGILLPCLFKKIKERKNIYRYRGVSEFL